MPPRFAYWTIIVDNQPTSFRSSSIDELMPTFNRLKQKNPSAVMMWFQKGRLWVNRLDAQEAMRARARHSAPGTPHEARGTRHEALDRRGPDGKLVWKPKGTFEPEARSPRSPQSEVRSPKWRPGGDHKDPRQKYKDAKKARWTRFKEKIRSRSARPPKKRDR